MVDPIPLSSHGPRDYPTASRPASNAPTQGGGGFLRDRILLITGAGRGIGPNIAHAACEVGATAVLTGDDEILLKEEAKKLSKQRLNAIFSPLDVTDEAQVTDVFTGVHERFGRLDVLVHNAGAGRFRPILDMSLDDWYVQIQMNLTGAFLCFREALRLMSFRREGHIIVLNSLAARRPMPQPAAAYHATRVGLSELVDRFREEALGFGVRVTHLIVGAAEMAAWDLGDPTLCPPNQQSDPVELARQVVLLCRPRSSAMPQEIVLTHPHDRY